MFFLDILNTHAYVDALFDTNGLLHSHPYYVAISSYAITDSRVSPYYSDPDKLLCSGSR